MILVLAGLACGCGVALAHHGFTGRYDTDRPVWIEGIVRGASFGRPHATLTIEMDPAARPAAVGLPEELTGPPVAAGAGQLTIELAPVEPFFALRERLAMGHRFALVALRNCQPPHQLRSQWLRLADGSVVERRGRLSYMQAGCGAS